MTQRSLLTLLLLLPSLLFADALRVPAHFGDHAILQREMPIRLWGWAKPNATVDVELAQEVASTKADAEGHWQVELAALPAGGPHTLVVESGDERLASEDILIGEVWIASGQSNMEWVVNNTNNRDALIARMKKGDLRIREFKHRRHVETSPQPESDGAWLVPDAESIKWVSGVAAYFATDLHDNLKVPVGILNASWGGTRAATWTPWEVLEQIPEHKGELAADLKYQQGSQKELSRTKLLREAWEENKFAVDPGNRGFALGYAEADFDDKDWKPMHVPGSMEKQGLEIDGAVWFRKKVFLPGNWEHPTTLHLGPIDDFDVTYANGVEVGRTGKETEKYWQHKRAYTFGKEAAVPGEELQLAVRVFDHFGEGGFNGAEHELSLKDANGQSLALAGNWQHLVEVSIPDPMNSGAHRLPGKLGENDQNRPSRLYNGMLHPLIPTSIRGAIWYQGESDSGKYKLYETVFPAMITSWREAWGYDFPFYYVQITRFAEPVKDPVQGGWSWAFIRESQESALSLEKTGMACLIDEGEADDIHPRNKQVVGKRLARLALVETYGLDGHSRHASYRSHETLEDGRVRLHVDNTYGRLLTSDSKRPRGFAVRSEHGEWKWAKVDLDGESILLAHPEKEKIDAIRYGWASFPDLNVINATYLPLAPFRTDKD